MALTRIKSVEQNMFLSTVGFLNKQPARLALGPVVWNFEW